MAENLSNQKIERRFLNAFFFNLAIEARKEKTKTLILPIKKKSIESTEKRNLIIPHKKLIPINNKPVPSIMNGFIKRPNFAPPREKLNPQTQQITQMQNIDTLGKIQPMLSDPNILSIESLGPGKPIIINKRGNVKVTKLILSEDEINKVMKEFSEKTRIPLLPGLFRAVYGNLHITAVISEHVGTRFIIEKKKRLPIPHINPN